MPPSKVLKLCKGLKKEDSTSGNMDKTLSAKLEPLLTTDSIAKLKVPISCPFSNFPIICNSALINYLPFCTASTTELIIGKSDNLILYFKRKSFINFAASNPSTRVE